MRFRFDSVPHLIKMPRELQPRAEINKEIVEQYAKAMLMGSRFPPVVVFQTTSTYCTFWRDYYLSDGYHRMAAREIVIDELYPGKHWKFDGFRARIYTKDIGPNPYITFSDGERFFDERCTTNASYMDAILYTAQANWDNEDFPRTSYDKRRQIYLMLNSFPDWKDSQISKHCHIDFRLVKQVAEKWRAWEAKLEREKDMPLGLSDDDEEDEDEMPEGSWNELWQEIYRCQKEEEEEEMKDLPSTFGELYWKMHWY